MIDRYTRNIMGRIWTTENRFSKWLDIELAVCKAWNKLGRLPDESLKTISKRASFNVVRIDEIEKETKHDVIAFLTSLSESVGPDSRYIHMGLTSSDILDTSLSLLLRDSADIIISDIKGLMVLLKEIAFEQRMTAMIGRSHGVHAEPITFGLKMALWYDEMKRNLLRIKRARETISYGKISGAVGTFANVPPFIEEQVCKELGLKCAPVATQVLQRDRHAEFFTSIAVLASTIEKFAVEIRHLQRTEILELEEPFSKGQKGSSAMPHKRNPVLSENLTGLARLVRGYAMASLENIPLWHERDISHSSVERVIAPDATILVDFMLARMTDILGGINIYKSNMKKNMDLLGGLIFSQRILLSLIEKGKTREEAYEMVQRNAMKVWEGTGRFIDLVLSDEEVMSILKEDEVSECFDVAYHLKNIDYIFDRVFNEDKTL